MKCFYRDSPPDDTEQRYTAIGACLSREHFSYMVDFTYLQRGIRVRSEWYPIVKMEWAEGDPLNVYVQKQLGNARGLTSLAVQWVRMIQALQRAHIAHGDLQHGNVLIVNGALKLVDYDGMFVPTLSGKYSTELGQPNYQHPQRTELDFGPYLDNFSSWVILVSLVALSVYPNLWQTFRGGRRDCLLFRRRDFEDPEHSALLKALERCHDPQLRNLIEIFKIVLYSSPRDVPAFDNMPSLEIPAPVKGQAPSIPGWLQDHVGFQTPQPSPTQQRQDKSAAADPSWVLDFIVPAIAPPEFSTNVTSARILLFACVTGAVCALVFGWIALALTFTLGLIGTLFACTRQYRSEPAVHSRAGSYVILGEELHKS